jgi:prophage antirepressor-like protein
MEIISKNFQDNSDIRIILIDSKEWFVAKDIAEILGYTNTNKAIKDHCKKTVNFIDLFKSNDSLGLENSNLTKELGNNFKNTKFIPESDAWRLIIKSRLSEADKIEEWIMEDVLPSIRKTGSYSLQKVESPKPEISISETLSKSVEILHLIQLLKEQKTFDLFLLDGILENESPTKLLKIDFSQKYFLPTELGFLKGMSGAEMNLELQKKGLQIRENEKWVLTEKGREFGIEIGGKFSQLKWKLEALK